MNGALLLAQAMMLAADGMDATSCISCGSEPVDWGLVLLDGTVSQELTIAAWCARPECRTDLSPGGLQALVVPYPGATPDVRLVVDRVAEAMLGQSLDGVEAACAESWRASARAAVNVLAPELEVATRLRALIVTLACECASSGEGPQRDCWEHGDQQSVELGVVARWLRDGTPENGAVFP